ncbi:tumor necrosis factor receptor superfamily member 27 [Tachyglossus aculeatus]|uniref:tumor necrosis factor receptor superfamily member 27 n=1 Tax=Tachyglossus aculeatus TaxID=9261 RepID=UPI0018F537B2|nr:tumor necrosis factor receptor superfamily member 27 [Tachyglossus aculeatus]
MVCQENQFQDERGQCVDCGQCGPGWELAKECGYGEGGPSPCTVCPRRRFKATQGHHGCQACTSCALFNRVQTASCTGTADAVCGHCLPGFYSKTRIGGRQDRECFPCSPQTPPSENQCPVRLDAGQPPGPSASWQEAVLVTLVSCALVAIALVLVALAFLYLRRFLKSHCQQVFRRSQDFMGQMGPCPMSSSGGCSPDEEPPPGPWGLAAKSWGSCVRPAAAGASAVDDVAPGLQMPLAPAGCELCPACPTPGLGPRPAASSPDTQLMLCSSEGHSGWAPGSLSSAGPPGAGPPPASAPASCASETHARWPHAPVECTEFDLHKFSNIGTNEGAGPVSPSCCLHARRPPQAPQPPTASSSHGAHVPW